MRTAKEIKQVIDYFALALAHALLAIGFMRLAGNDALDREDPMPGHIAPASNADTGEAAERQA